MQVMHSRCEQICWPSAQALHVPGPPQASLSRPVRQSPSAVQQPGQFCAVHGCTLVSQAVARTSAAATSVGGRDFILASVTPNGGDVCSQNLYSPPPRNENPVRSLKEWAITRKTSTGGFRACWRCGAAGGEKQAVPPIIWRRTN